MLLCVGKSGRYYCILKPVVRLLASSVNDTSVIQHFNNII
jgi:hypothetical protein